MKINPRDNAENFLCGTGDCSLLSVPQGCCRIHFVPCRIESLTQKNYHSLVSDKEQRAVEAEMPKNDFSCHKEFRVSGSRGQGAEKTLPSLPSHCAKLLSSSNTCISHFWEGLWSDPMNGGENGNTGWSPLSCTFPSAKYSLC